MNRDYSVLPEHMREGMQRYIEHGIVPGSFLRSVLENDLMGALKNADDINLHRLPDYGRFLYNDMPTAIFGSPKKVKAHAKAMAEQREKEQS